MPIETFHWPVQHGDTPTFDYRVRTSQFGDGYRQVSADGINNKQQSWPVTFTGNRSTVREIVAFLDRHGGARSFLWTTPLGDTGFYTCLNPKPTPIGGGQFRLSATFEQAFHP